MIDPIVLKAARRLKIGKDLSVLANAWQDEQLGLVTSTPVEQGGQIFSALTRYHSIGEFTEFVDQLATEAEKYG